MTFVRVHKKKPEGGVRCGLFAWHEASDDIDKVNCRRCLRLEGVTEPTGWEKYNRERT